jgi:hypothetical protein
MAQKLLKHTIPIGFASVESLLQDDKTNRTVNLLFLLAVNFNDKSLSSPINLQGGI